MPCDGSRASASSSPPSSSCLKASTQCLAFTGFAVTGGSLVWGQVAPHRSFAGFARTGVGPVHLLNLLVQSGYKEAREGNHYHQQKRRRAK